MLPSIPIQIKSNGVTQSIAGLALILSTLLDYRALGVAPLEENSASCFQAATYNIRYDAPHDKFSWELRRQGLIALLDMLNLEIFGLQEVLVNQFEDIYSGLEALGIDYGVAIFGRDGADASGKPKGESLPIYYDLAKWRLLASGRFWLADIIDRPAPEGGPFPWGTKMNRLTTWVKLASVQTGKTLFVINTHFDHQSITSQKRSAKLIEEFIRNSRQFPGRPNVQAGDSVLFMGDLNATKASGRYRNLLQSDMLSDSVDLSLTPPIINIHNPSTLTQWTKLAPGGRHIDHVFVRGVESIASYEVVSSTIEIEFGGESKSIFPSDHLPVMANVCL